MVFTKAFALAAIFATLTAAAPVHQKRAVVYETVTEVDVTTIDTTITLYPGEPTPTVASVYTTEVAVTSTATSPAENAVTPTSTPTATASPAPVAETATTPTEAPVAAAVAATTTAAPVPTTTVAPAPVDTTTSSSSSTSTSATSTSTPAPEATSTTTTSSTSSSSGSGPSGTGDGTYYDTATSMSAPSYCDTANDGTTENVVALSQAIMTEALCGAKITVSYNGKTTTGTVVDKCMGCDAQSIDMSRAMFGDLASLDAGRITVSWSV